MDHRSVGERPVQRTAREVAERRILAVLLAEPGRWHGLVGAVDVADFTDPACGRLAGVYWQHQQDEGEPAFNDFLDVLRAASDQTLDLAGFGIELMDEYDARPADAEGQLTDAAVLLAEAVALVAEMRAAREQDKHCGPSAAYQRCRGRGAEPNRYASCRNVPGRRTCGGWAAKLVGRWWRVVGWTDAVASSNLQPATDNPRTTTEYQGRRPPPLQGSGISLSTLARAARFCGSHEGLVVPRGHSRAGTLKVA